jgi:hypothetical protein
MLRPDRTTTDVYLHRAAIDMRLRFPTKPAGYSNAKAATCSDSKPGHHSELMAAGVATSQRVVWVISHNRVARQVWSGLTVAKRLVRHRWVLVEWLDAPALKKIESGLLSFTDP